MFISPAEILKNLNLEIGMHVADIGAGSGFYTLSIAREIGSSGHVYAIDIQKELLLKIKNDANRGHLNNVDIVWGDVEIIGGTKLKDKSVDVAIVSNIFFQLDDRQSAVKEIARILREGGKVLFIEWSNAFPGIGPSLDKVLHKEQMLALFKQAGFDFVKDVPAGDHHYGMILRH